jgi:hypothetical protein
MAISNTSILIKRSSATAKPTSLAAGELAYSYLSNTLFIGTSGGTGTLNIGGYLYTSTIDSATAANVASTLVKRDTNGAFFGRLFGISNTALAWNTARTIGVSGDATGTVLIDGTADANIPLVLTNTGVVAGQYGSSSQVPTIIVASNGRVLNVTTNTISTSFTVSGNGGSGIQSGGGTLTIQGGSSGIVTSVTGSGGSETVTINTNDTILRSNTSAVGRQLIATDLQITGNLVVTGNSQYFNTTSLNIADPLIYLAANNYSSDLVDIGFVGNYYDGVSRHAGVFRHAASNKFYAFFNYTPNPGDSNVIDPTHVSFRKATFVANISGGIISGLANSIGILDGGTNSSSYTTNEITYYNGSAIVSLANTGTAGTVGSSSYIPVITTDGFGRVSGVSNTQIQVDASLISSGILSLVRGGTNNTSYSNGQRLFFDGSKIASLANTTTTVTGGLSASNTITSLTVDSYGGVTAYTGDAIAIDASQVTTGTLPITRGGTNQTSYTPGSLVFYNGTSLASFANSTYTQTGTGAANNTITSVTVDNYGRVTAATFSAISGLTVGQGGTGASTFTTRGILYGNGTGALQATAAADTSDQTWSNQILTVTNAGVPVWSTAMDGGMF